MVRKAQSSPNDSVFDYEPEDIEMNESESKALGDLADLDSSVFSDYEWNIYRLRTAEDMAKSGTRSPRVWIAKRVGPINLNEIQADYGGGWFEFWGRLNGVTRHKFRREIDGDPKLYRTAPAATNGNASSQGPRTDASSPTPVVSVQEAVRRAVHRERRRHQAELDRQQREAERKQRDDEQRRLEAQIAELKQLVTQTATRPAPEQKPERLKDLAETLMMLRQLAPDGAGGINPLELMKLAREWMDHGIVMGEKREPGSGDGGDGWNAERITAIAQAVTQILTRMTPPRQPPPRGPQPAPADTSGSHAEVVPTPPAQPDNPLHRWKGAVEAVARNMVRGRGADDTAATLEDLLNEEELANLKGRTMDDGVWHPTATEALEWLESQGVGKFPQLESDGGKVYLDSVLAELRKPEDD